MANSILISFRTISCSLRKNVISVSNSLLQNARFLYSAEALGTDTFLRQQQQIKNQMANIEIKFREKMNIFTDSESKNMIFTEDLKNMIHLASSDEDINLVIKMMKKFNQQNKQLRFGSFVFGPVVMRLLHINNKPDVAFQCFTAPELNGFFDQLITYQILLDLLYENEKYDEVIKTFEIIKDRQLDQTKYPRNVVVLTMAACYKLNTQESLEYALKLWKELSNVGHIPVRRACTFCAGLALKQGNPAAALEILSTVKNVNYTTVRNIKVAALTAVGRVDDALPILKSILTDDQPGLVHHTFNREVIEDVKSSIEKLDNPDISLEFNRLEKLFEKQGHISNLSLEEQLCAEIQKPPNFENNRQQNRFSRYNPPNNRTNFRSTKFRSRPGLEDIA